MTANNRSKDNSIEPITICDSEGNEIQYTKLAMAEKENVLTELLFQSALQNIAVQQMVF